MAAADAEDGAGAGGDSAPTASIGLALNVLGALAGSRLTAEERAAVCGGILRSLSARPSAASPVDEDDLAVGVAGAEDVQQRVEASWLVLQERLVRSGEPSPSAVLEVSRKE